MALPHYAYRDPALIVESEQLHRLGCKGCSRATLVFDRAVCTNGLKYPACKQDSRKGYKLLAKAGGAA